MLVIAWVAAAATPLAGCGLGRHLGTSAVTLTVTRGFGSTPVVRLSEQRVPGSETVTQMLERHVRVGIAGGAVESIDGLAGGPARLEWSYYVNGIKGPKRVTATAVYKGDRIWWDLHDGPAAASSAAVVGSFPEPFLHGIGGRRLPTALQCASDASAACKRVAAELGGLGVPVASQLIGGASGSDSLSLVVGTWRDIRPEIVASLLEQGPAASGVYARFAGSGGDRLELLGPDGHVARTLGAGAGLVAATAQGSSEPVWLITGTDVAGVEAAAAVFTRARLQDHFALAVYRSTALPVPVQSKLG